MDCSHARGTTPCSNRSLPTCGGCGHPVPPSATRRIDRARPRPLVRSVGREAVSRAQRLLRRIWPADSQTAEAWQTCYQHPMNVRGRWRSDRFSLGLALIAARRARGTRHLRIVMRRPSGESATGRSTTLGEFPRGRTRLRQSTQPAPIWRRRAVRGASAGVDTRARRTERTRPRFVPLAPAGRLRGRDRNNRHDRPRRPRRVRATSRYRRRGIDRALPERVDL